MSGEQRRPGRDKGLEEQVDPADAEWSTRSPNGASGGRQFTAFSLHFWDFYTLMD